MKYFFYLLGLSWGLLLAHPVHSQSSDDTVPEAACATPEPTEQEMQNWPWFGDTLFLPHYYDSLRTALDGAGILTHQSGGIS